MVGGNVLIFGFVCELCGGLGAAMGFSLHDFWSCVKCGLLGFVVVSCPGVICRVLWVWRLLFGGGFGAMVCDLGGFADCFSFRGWHNMCFVIAGSWGLTVLFLCWFVGGVGAGAWFWCGSVWLWFGLVFWNFL